MLEDGAIPNKNRRSSPGGRIKKDDLESPVQVVGCRHDCG